jgi:hypothetical protein
METTGPEKLLLDVVKVLDGLKIKYFITGGFAVSVWGRPRSTADIDIVIELVEPQIDPFLKVLRNISAAGYVDEDAAKYAVRNRAEFNFIDPETGIKVDFWIMEEDQIAKNQYSRRKTKIINKTRINFISPEDLIINKLIWYKETMSSRHLEDIKSIISISKIDKNYIRRMAKLLDLEDILRGIKFKEPSKI